MTQQALMAALALGATAAPIQGQTQQATQRSHDRARSRRLRGRLRLEVCSSVCGKMGTPYHRQNATISLSDDVATTAAP